MPPCAVPAGRVSADVNRKYAKEFAKDSEATKARLAALGPAMAKYGYAMANLEAAPSAATLLRGRAGPGGGVALPISVAENSL